jgi:DNA-binding HxlR family transcriptional regulator
MSDAENICPRFHVAVELIGGRWTGAIISRLLAGEARYNELRAAIPDISDRMLSERLRALEAEGVLTRTVFPDSPVRVEYALTAKGRGLEDALDAIGKWATRWISEADLARSSSQSAAIARPRSAASTSKSARRAKSARRR